MITIKNILLVGTGGFAGSICRFIISAFMANTQNVLSFPLGTFTVNSAGSLIIGFVMACVGPQHAAYLLLATGFCGGFTTFSTFSLETFGMIKDGNYAQSAVYIMLSVIICVTMVWVGMYLGHKTIK